MKTIDVSSKLPNLLKSGTQGVEGKPSSYSPPRLERIADAESLLEILGPAQAFYRGAGFNNP